MHGVVTSHGSGLFSMDSGLLSMDFTVWWPVVLGYLAFQVSASSRPSALFVSGTRDIPFNVRVPKTKGIECPKTRVATPNAETPHISP